MRTTRNAAATLAIRSPYPVRLNCPPMIAVSAIAIAIRAYNGAASRECPSANSSPAVPTRSRSCGDGLNNWVRYRSDGL